MIEQVTGELNNHGYCIDSQKTDHQVLDIQSICRLGDFETKERTVDDAGFIPHAGDQDNPCQRQSQKQGPDTVDPCLGGFTESRIQHIDADMALVNQCIGAGEKKQGRIPEANKIPHEWLLVGKYKAGNNDLELCQYDQKGKPDKSQRSIE